jgi:hypothetical protein
MEMFINITEDKFEAKEWEYIMHAFNCLPNVLKDIKLLFNSNERDKNFYIHYADKAVDINVIKSNNLQKFLKVVKNRTESLDLQTKHKIDLSPNEISRLIQRTLRNTKDPKLKHLIFRCWHGDIYSRSRMRKFNMTETMSCERCGMTETQKHQIFECKEAKLFWNAFNRIMELLQQPQSKIFSYNDVMLGSLEDIDIVTILRIIFIKINIQIVRPMFSEKIMWNFINKHPQIQRECAKSSKGKDLWASLVEESSRQESSLERVDLRDTIA